MSAVLVVICLGVASEFHLGLPTTYCTVSCSALLHIRINIIIANLFALLPLFSPLTLVLW